MRNRFLHFFTWVNLFLAGGVTLSHGQTPAVYEKVHSFAEARELARAGQVSGGRNPAGGVTLGRDGNFYGTTRNGGAVDAGTVFRLSPDGVVTTLVEFTGEGTENRGREPVVGLVQGGDNNFYGTTRLGGAGDGGTVFRMTPSGELTTLLEFGDLPAYPNFEAGKEPFGYLLLEANGLIHGTAQNGGLGGLGTVFTIDRDGTVIRVIPSPGGGRNPRAALTRGSDGNLYGTALLGGGGGAGMIYRISPQGEVTTLVNFNGPNGTSPRGSLLEGPDGNFYGTTIAGGSAGAGTIFRMTPAGVLTTLVHFGTAFMRGRSPEIGLTLASDGNFYGVTYAGGFANAGTIFRFSPVEPMGTFFTLVDFTGDGAFNRGSAPLRTPLVQGPDGFLYGTTYFGGEANLGTVFKMTLEGQLTTLVEFGGGIKGRAPTGALLFGGDLNYFGVSASGGRANRGTVFKVSQSGVLTNLVDFTGPGGANRGSEPRGRLLGFTTGPATGDFFGTTVAGGARDDGTIYKVTSSGELTTQVEFTGAVGPNKGRSPQAGLGNYGTTSRGGALDLGTIFQWSGDTIATLVEFTGNGSTNKGSEPCGELLSVGDNHYGTTRGGGAFDQGTIFRMTSTGVLTTLVEFTGNGATAKGTAPRGALVAGTDGNFYGTTERGGANRLGTIFKMTPSGQLTTLVEFTGVGGAQPGSFPRGSLVRAQDGDFYGTTYGGGVENRGTIFRLTAGGTFTTLYEFTAGPSNRGGARPDGSLYGGNLAGVLGLFGTTSRGGTDRAGTVFFISLNGEFSEVGEFSGDGATSSGSDPAGALVQDPDGTWYGTTKAGGTEDLGTIFSVSADLTTRTLVSFTGVSGDRRGGVPEGLLVRGPDGDFYGTTSEGGQADAGTIFKVNKAGVLTTLVEFTDQATGIVGRCPRAGLVLGSDGNFYGTTEAGGAADLGTIFRMTPSGALTTLVQLTGRSGANRGARPKAELVQGANGSFYGSTQRGGANEAGTLFRITPEGVMQTLVDFSGTSGANLGRAPMGRLLRASDGNFYGTTAYGGPSDLGTFFRMTPEGGRTVLHSFTAGYHPMGRLAQTSDGRIYGTTQTGENGVGQVFSYAIGGSVTVFDALPEGEVEANPAAGLTVGQDGCLYGPAGGGDGGIFRLVTPGAPSVYGLAATTQGTGVATVSAQVNARGSKTNVTLAYGTDGIDFPNRISVALQLADYQGRLVGTSLGALAPAQTYYYRFEAVSSAGTTVSPVRSFSTLAEPIVTVELPTEISSSTGRFNGTVNARSFESTVAFEWGTDGNSFPNVVPASPATVTGDTAVNVTVAVAGLPEGGAIFYRVRATNAAGTVISGVRSFSTIGVTTTAAAQVGVSEATFKATINTFGKPALVKFKYWEEAAAGQLFETAPQNVTSSGPVEVSARVTGLRENVAYRYRVSVEIGGTETDGGAVPMTTALNLAPTAVNDYFFYAGQVVIDPLNGITGDSDANDLDVDGNPTNTRLRIRPGLLAATAPDQTTYLDKARVTQDGKLITYNAGDAQPENEYFRYQVEDPQGASATARIHLIHFRTRAGLYTKGITVKSAPTAPAQDRGDAIAFQLSRTGAGTGRLFWEGARYPLGGNFDERGVLLREPGKEGDATRKLVVRLTLPEAGGSQRSVLGRIEETIIATGEVVLSSDFSAPLDAVSVVRPGQLNGFLTVIGGAADDPDGYLVFTIQNTPTRRARFVGRLPGTQAFSGQAAVSQFSYGLSVPIGKKARDGVLSGAVNIVQNVDGAKPAAMVGTLTLTTLAGEEIPLNLDGTQWRAPAKNLPAPLSPDPAAAQYDATLRLSGGDLPSAVDAALVITARGAQLGALTAATPGATLPTKLKLSLNAKAGTFSGSFTHPGTGAKTLLNGALIPAFGEEAGEGRGSFGAPGAAGQVRLMVSPSAF